MLFYIGAIFYFIGFSLSIRHGIENLALLFLFLGIAIFEFKLALNLKKILDIEKVKSDLKNRPVLCFFANYCCYDFFVFSLLKSNRWISNSSFFKNRLFFLCAFLITFSFYFVLFFTQCNKINISNFALILLVFFVIRPINSYWGFSSQQLLKEKFNP